ncbi:MAG: NAD-glutamate dehydrogenase domain-containing protein [Planctomycetota bacterium]
MPAKSAQMTEERLSANDLVDRVSASLRKTAQEVVPWFVEQMPPMYFQDTDQPTQLWHLQAIIAAKASGRPLELTLRSEDGSQWTAMRPLDYPGVLAELAGELPKDRKLRRAKIHTARDGTLVLDTFEFGEMARFDPESPEQAAKLQATLEYAREHCPDWKPDQIQEFFARCTGDYVLTLTPLRLANHWELYEQVTGTDGTAIHLEPESDPTQCRITVAYGNATTQVMLARIATRLSRSMINIHRAYLDNIEDSTNGRISLLGFVVTGPDGGPIDPESDLWQRVRLDLLRNKWIDDRTLRFAYSYPEFDVTDAEIVTGLCDLSHQVLTKVNPYAFNPDRILALAEGSRPQVRKIVNLFLDRFDPREPLTEEEFEEQAGTLEHEVDAEVDLEDSRTVLHTLLRAVRSVLRTNVYLDFRYGLALRLDPMFLMSEDRPELPYGVFFVHGRSFNGFHVRFRDIARGGLRVIRTPGVDQHAREAERLYDEAYNLAYAQQLKNKDIPEGGSKAAVLLAPDARLRRSVKGFVDSILDLITPDEETREMVVDRFGQQELLYLGPDENITPELIEWVVDRARRRGYPTPNALMSSKPGAGINHKEYGVTSEGVTVFLDVALRSVGIDPQEQPFTVKITGGPDGDVAGNEIRILHRDYGDRVRIVGIADGSGSAEDSDGLDHVELLRLVDASLPIAQFDKSRLGPRGRVTALDEPDGVQLRNSLHNRLVADAFIPAGGRPSAIHSGNWQEFLRPDGTGSSRLVVEGANLFITPEARMRLSESGVLIVKDSSANKCGVICSSFEIIASMLLSEEEFLVIKDEFVEQVLDKLRGLARREAEVLMRLHRYHPNTPLPETSVRLSAVMIRTADAIESAIDTLSESDQMLFNQLVVEHLPSVLVDSAGERLWKDAPRPYLKWIMAKSLSARIVYREGFEALEAMTLEAIADLAIEYLRMERERRSLADQVAASDLPDRERIARLLRKAGIFPTLGE